VLNRLKKLVATTYLPVFSILFNRIKPHLSFDKHLKSLKSKILIINNKPRFII